MTNKTQPTHPHLSDEQKLLGLVREFRSAIGWSYHPDAKAKDYDNANEAEDALIEAIVSCLATPPVVAEGGRPESSIHAGCGTITKDLQATPLAAAEAPAVQINGALATAHSLLAALLDIYDDAQNNAPEHRCYIDSAWSDVLKEARQFLAAQPKADTDQAEGVLQREYCQQWVNPASAQAGEVSDAPLLYLNPKIVDPTTGKIAASGALTWSDSPVGGWTMAVYRVALRSKAQPLTDAQIDQITQAAGFGRVWYENTRGFARAIEAAHGIASPTKGEGS